MEAWVEVKTNMAALVALQLLTNTSRRALDMHAVYQRRISPVKSMLDTEDNLMNFMLPFSLVNLTQDRKTRSRDEIRNFQGSRFLTGRHLEIRIPGNIAKI